MADFTVPFVPELPDTPHLDPYLIAHCELCDDDGYRNNRVCDHVDHSEVIARGMAKVRAALSKERVSQGLGEGA
jgi:hypothetical protein